MAVRQKRQAWRTCVACGRKAPQGELLRLAVSDGRVRRDPKRLLPGRGAYVCQGRGCLQTLAKDRKRARAFRGRLGEDAWSELFIESGE
ncbi:hypothetical protein AAU61_07810 [Desulfocarbo indianensis]|nr:hypothetical protein AAU61_07810 [Desulfocarbo indianensis]